MNVIAQLQSQGCISKSIQEEIDPSKPTYWSQHVWDFKEHSAKVLLTFFKSVQHGRTLLMGHMALGQVDALCGVPAFHSGITNAEAAEIALYPGESPPYQRPPVVDRFEGIEAFLADESSILLNPITLHAPLPALAEGGAIRIVEEDDVQVVLEIDLEVALVLQNDGTYTDVDEEHGVCYRPFHVTDGSHRKLSCGLNLAASQMHVPVVLAPLGTTMAEAATIFTQSNVAQEALKPLHMLLQRYTCKIPHRRSELDFGDPEGDDRPAIRRRRRSNRRAFKLAATLAVRPNPLFGRIQMLELPGRRLAAYCAVTSKKMVKYGRRWFTDGELLGGMSDADAFRLFRSYLTAWEEIVETDENGADYDDGFLRWGINRERGQETIPYLMMPLPFEVVLMLFPLIFKAVKDQKDDDERVVWQDFLKILAPLQPIDWGQTALLKATYGTDKDTAANLYSWASWAILAYVQTGTIYPANQVWNPEDRTPDLCLAGRGFLSPPSRHEIKPTLELPQTDEHGLVAGQRFTLWCHPMANINKRPLLSVQLLDEHGEIHFSTTNLNVKNTADLGFTSFTVEMPEVPEGAVELRASATVHNVNGEAKIEKSWPLHELQNMGPNMVKPFDEDLAPDALNVFDGAQPHDEEEDEEGVRFTLVPVDDTYMPPPPAPNTTVNTTSKVYTTPWFATIQQCPLCSSGQECRNANCVGKTVEGFVWR